MSKQGRTKFEMYEKAAMLCQFCPLAECDESDSRCLFHMRMSDLYTPSENKRLAARKRKKTAVGEIGAPHHNQGATPVISGGLGVPTNKTR